MEHVDKIVYINLDSRPDRRAQVERALRSLRLAGDGAVERFPAVAHPCGAIGCSLSHLAVLRRAESENWACVCILEDDFEPTVDADTWHARVAALFARIPDFDVAMLASNPQRAAPVPACAGVARTLFAGTTAGYLVQRPFYRALIQNIEEGLAQFTQAPHRGDAFAIDVYFRPLQLRSKWYHFSPKLGKQRASYSDVEGTFVDYGT